ncbi:ribonuclease H-like domain, reverse transcriptase, RNA-dependent DNA polymerase [Tanacetum coccineum]
MEESLSKFMNESAKIHEENSNLIKEIRAFIDTAIRNQGTSIKALEIQIRQMSKMKLIRPRYVVLDIPDTPYLPNTTGSYGLQDLDAYSVRTILHGDSLPKKEKDPRNRTVKHPKGIAKNILIGIDKFVFPIDFIILDMPEDVNVPLILGRPFLSTAHAKIDVFKRNITLRVRDEKIIFKSVKPASSLIKRVYMLSLKERMDFDLEARLMGETLILNRSFDPYIELNHLNEPQELRRNRVDDLEPTVEGGEIVNEPIMEIVKTMCDFIGGLDYYPSDCDFDKRIHIDCAYNLRFSCMIGYE